MSLYAQGDVLLGKYELLAVIAQGGMGVVWRAKNRTLDVDVALKITHDPSCSGGERNIEAAALVQRAITEARLAAQLCHPAICRVLDFGVTEHGDACVISELLHGQTFEDLLAQRGRLSPTEASALMLPILDGLALAHAQGVVHRDVKPANIFLSHGSQASVQPKLLDFGIARCTRQSPRRTTTGKIFGTPCYMSPEQARGSPDVDARSDVWSLCVTLYELVAGETPFDGENYNAVLWAVQNRHPPSLAESSLADPAFWAILARGLRKSPEARWRSADELAVALSGWLLSQGVQLDACGVAIRAPVAPAGAPGLASTTSSAPAVNWAAEDAGASPVESAPPALLATACTLTLRSEKPPARRLEGRGFHAAATVAGALLLVGGSWAVFDLTKSRLHSESSPDVPQRGGELRASPPVRAEAPRSAQAEISAGLPAGSAIVAPPTAPPSHAKAASAPVAVTGGRRQAPLRSAAAAPLRAEQRDALSPPGVPQAVQKSASSVPSVIAPSTGAASATGAVATSSARLRENALGYDFGL